MVPVALADELCNRAGAKSESGLATEAQRIKRKRILAVAGHLRARAEEMLLERAFGDTYREYRKRTKRFIPGLY